MWCLMRAMPLLIGDRIPIGDERWDHFTKLLSIMDYIFAPKITKASWYTFIVTGFTVCVL